LLLSLNYHNATTMCRWVTFISTEEMLLSDLVLKPSNSLVDQSIDASFHPGFAQVRTLLFCFARACCFFSRTK